MASDEATSALEGTNKRKKRELVVNTKWEQRSTDPLYSHLIYSSEVDVVLTAKRGKAWQEMKAAETFRAENDRKFRERNAMSESTPVVLSYLFGNSKVQGEADVTKDREILVQDTMLSEGLKVIEVSTAAQEDGMSQESIMTEEDAVVNKSFKKSTPELPFSVYTDLQSIKQADIDHDSTNTDTPDRRGRRKRSRGKAEPEVDAGKEDPEYDIIPDSLHVANVREMFTEDHLFKHGTPDPSAAGTKQPCGGCGALLHCTDEKIPGYLPSQLLQDRSPEEMRSLLCQRCYIIKEYNVALKMTVSPEDYPKAIEHIKDKEALVLLVVDLLDFPGSVWPGILTLLGSKKKVIVVGNKLDLIVPDSRVYQKRITNIIREEFLKKWRKEEESSSVFPQIVASCCVSATTGLNIETLIEIIFDNWRASNDFMPGDIYIVGCTNVGKSSLFNALLDSDLCKIDAMDRVQKAIISPIPGTTLNLLKFPLSRPEPHFLLQRRKRLSQADKAFWAAEDARLALLAKHPRLHLAIPSHYAIKHTLLGKLTEIKGSYMNTVDTSQVEGVGVPQRLDPNVQEWRTSKYCYDSPGTVSQEQIINLLTSEEVSLALANTPLHPRSFMLKRDQTLLLAGLARLDYVEGLEERLYHPLIVTVFCSSLLPINIVKTVSCDQFLASAAGSELLKVPSANRGTKLPPLLGRKVEVESSMRQGGDWYHGARDIVLSSVGWVMVSGKEGETNGFIAYTPGGKGISERPPFLPFSVSMRGRRVQATPKFRSDYFLTRQLRGSRSFQQ